MYLQRLLLLCDVLRECELLRPGVFRLWARANAIREIAEVVCEATGRKFFVAWR